MFRIVTKKTIQKLNENYFQIDLNDGIVRHFVYVYCAIRQLIAAKSKYLLI